MVSPSKALWALGILCLGLGAAPRQLAGACVPTSATLTFAADDYFYFYVNGNNVTNGTDFNPGNPPVSIAVPIGFFNGGGNDYFAARVRNSNPSLVGAVWRLDINCSGGATSYVTNADSSYNMYNDTSGGVPPPADWMQTTFTDPGSLFTQSPVLAPQLGWFNPKLNHPLTGTELPMLSHSVSGTQASNTQNLYFRQVIVLPEITPTVTMTPTISPTPYPPGCGPPNFIEAKVLGSGCLGSTGSWTSAAYNFTASPNQLLVLRLTTSNNSTVPSAASFGGQAMTYIATSNVGSGDGNRMHAFYLHTPPTSGTLSFSYPNANCSWNVVTELYDNVSSVSPVGFVSKFGGNAAGSSPYNFTFNVSTTGPASLVSVHISSDQIQNNGDKPVSTSGATDMNLLTAGPASVDGGGGEAVAGSYKVVNGPGSYAFTYNLNQANRWWDVQPLEIRGNTCGTPTFTATSTQTQLPSVTPSSTVTPSSSSTRTVTATSTSSASPSHSRTATPLPGSPTFTATSSISPSSTATPTATPTFSATSTSTVTPTRSSTITLTHSSTATPLPGSPTDTATASATPTATASFSASPTLSATPSVTLTPSISPTHSASPSFTVGPTAIPPGGLIEYLGAYPNPFRDKITLIYLLRGRADVALTVFNVAGEIIYTDQFAGVPGKNIRVWEGINAAGGRVASGVYIVKAHAGTVVGQQGTAWSQAAVSR